MPRPKARLSNPLDWSDDTFLLGHWCLEMLDLVRTGGVLSTTRPSPLSRREIAEVLRVVRRFPEYRGQTILIHADDGHVVCLRGGR